MPESYESKYGIVVGGPMDGQLLTAQGNRYQVPEYDEAELAAGPVTGPSDPMGTTTVTIHTYSHVSFPFNNVKGGRKEFGFWLHDSMDMSDLMQRLVDRYLSAQHTIRLDTSVTYDNYMMRALSADKRPGYADAIMRNATSKLARELMADRRLVQIEVRDCTCGPRHFGNPCPVHNERSHSTEITVTLNVVRNTKEWKLP